jgi:hypothetical protein
LHPVRSARRVDAQEHRSAAEDAGLDAQGMGSLKNAVAADNHIPGLFPKVSPWASPTRLDKASDTHLLNRQNQYGLQLLAEAIDRWCGQALRVTGSRLSGVPDLPASAAITRATPLPERGISRPAMEAPSARWTAA